MSAYIPTNRGEGEQAEDNGGVIHRRSRLAGLHRVLAPCGLALLIAGCATQRQPNDVPNVTLPPSYNKSHIDHFQVSKLSKLNEKILANWWQEFDNEELNHLVDRSLAHNHNLRMSAQRVVQATARASQSASDRLPVVTAPIEYEAEAPDSIGSVPKGGDIKTRRTYRAGVRADWRIDVWGERESAYHSADLQTWYNLFLYDEERRQLIGNVVRSYIEYLALNDRLRAARETETLISDVLSSLMMRMGHGDATVIDLERQKAAVYATQTMIPTLILERERIRNRLAMLTGGLPHQLQLGDDGLDSLLFIPTVPKVPSRLLYFRPDIRAAEAQLLSADADIDVARAKLMPTFDLTAEVGYGSIHLQELFEPHTLFWRFLANMTATIFDHGRREQEVTYANSVYEELLENYYRTIYGAIQDVELSLAAIRYNLEKVENQQIATQAAMQAWRYSEEVYGLDELDFFSLLDTARTYQRNLQDLYEHRMEKYLSLANLYVSLGGGVPLRAALPGEGKRPEFNPLPPGEQESESGSIVWQPFQLGDIDARQDVWLVELAGIHSRSTGEATWRDLQSRYPELIKGRALLPRVIQETVDQEGRSVEWYRLYVASFDSHAAAETWCQTFQQMTQRCSLVEFAAVDGFAARLPWKGAPE